MLQVMAISLASFFREILPSHNRVKRYRQNTEIIGYSVENSVVMRGLPSQNASLSPRLRP